MKKNSSVSALKLVEQAIVAKAKGARKGKAIKYTVPSLWESATATPKAVKVNPYEYYLKAVKRCSKPGVNKKQKPTGGEWSKDAVIYNMFVRTTAAFDHNGNGTLDLPLNESGFRETGTFLKAIAMLPYIKRLGATVIHMLPVTAIGHDGNKGALGSPYAIRNQYELDENLSEPALGLDVKTEFKAFIEAAHAMGLRVVAEFVFRTSAKDGDWVREHPEWFYWIREEIQLRQGGEMDESKYGSPVFHRHELDAIHAAVREGRLDQLPAPHQQYRDFFTVPPKSENVIRENGRYIGILENGQRVKIPGAFADWPPDDNQPPWGDVTYLKLYEHRDFNYIGYNTIRMYDSRLARQEHINRPLWDKLIGVVPYYQREFGIDGVMIDMGHALPMDLKATMVKTARDIDPDFAFWDENFSIEQKSRQEGYNAVFGYLWSMQHQRNELKSFCWRLQNDGFPIPFFATPENHNTHRAADRDGGTVFSKVALAFNLFIPAIPFIHSGSEIGETYPINTGLGFSNEELQRMPSESLPLFSQFGYDWTRKEQFTGYVAKLLKIRSKYHGLVVNSDRNSFRVLDPGNESVIAYARVSESPKKRVAIVINSDVHEAQKVGVALDTKKKQLRNLVDGKPLRVVDGRLQASLKPGDVVIVEY
jgi:glycosidase